VTLATPPYTTTNPALQGDHRTFNTDTPFETNLDNVHIYTLELIWHTGFADVKYVGGYQGYTYTQESDFDGTSRTEPYTVLVGGAASAPGRFCRRLRSRSFRRSGRSIRRIKSITATRST
jgi:hypothetical protein